MPSDIDDATTRLFFAILPDDAARDRLDGLARDTARASGGRASAAYTLHLTIVFVGTVPADTAAAVRAAGETLRWPSFELRLDALGSFARAGIAWAAPSRVPPELATANRELVRALADRGVPTDARPYRPHVTLARRVRSAVGERLEPPFLWRADGFALVRSVTDPAGSRYEPLHWWNHAVEGG